MFNRILGAVAAAALTVLPVNARLEEGTSDLVNLIDDSGIEVLINNKDCLSGEYLGIYQYKGMKRAFILCPGFTVDAADHMVVRHEAIHAIQHCVNVARGTSVFTPVIQDTRELMAWVSQYLDDDDIARIKKAYERSHWLIEFEAFAGMHAYTADELSELFREACLYNEA